MIITENKTEVQKSDEIVTQGFKIKATAKAFKILSDGLYTDKILAICRELCCNAYDSHVAAGKKDEPFDVTLPSVMDPTFSVRDYGTGLSHEDVMNLYTTYFESTKTTSNDFIGALGLGSKSPFSYVDSFTVTSRFNGEKRFYAAFLNESGCPDIAQMGDVEKTDEPNGLEVSFPVKAPDLKAFSTKYEQATRFFKVQPKVICQTPIPVNAFVYTRDEPTWKIVQSQTYGQLMPMAIQGNVAYPINSHSLETHLTPEEKCVAWMPIHYYFNIGDLDVAANREGLSYEPNTIAAIKKRFQEIYDILIEENKDFYADCKTEYEAKTKFQNILKNGTVGQYNTTLIGFLRQAANKGALKLEWNGKLIKTNQIEFTDKFKGNKLLHIDVSMGHRQKRFKPLVDSDFTSSYGKKAIINCPERRTIYFDDLKTGGIGRVKARIGYDNIWLIRPKDGVAIADALTEMQSIFTPEIGVKFELTSKLPPITRAGSPDKDAFSYPVLAWKYKTERYYNQYHQDDWTRSKMSLVLKNCEQNKSKKIFYVPCYDNRPVIHLDTKGQDGFKGLDIKNFDGVVKLLRTYGKDLGFGINHDTPILGLRKMDLFLLEEEELGDDGYKFVNIVTMLDEFFKDPKKLKAAEKQLSLLTSLGFISNNQKFVEKFSDEKLINVLDTKSDLKKFLDEVAAIVKLKKQHHDFDQLGKGIKSLIERFTVKMAASEIDKGYELIIGKYPLLQYIAEGKTYYNTDDFRKHIAHYANAVDRI